MMKITFEQLMIRFAPATIRLHFKRAPKDSCFSIWLVSIFFLPKSCSLFLVLRNADNHVL